MDSTKISDPVIERLERVAQTKGISIEALLESWIDAETAAEPIQSTDFAGSSELASNETLLQSVVRDVAHGVLLQGPNAEILMSNQAACEMLGLTKDQLHGKTSYDPDWKAIHEDGSDFPGEDHPVPQAIRSGKPVRDVVMGIYRPKTNEWVWLLVDAVPQLNTDGQVNLVVTSFADITQLRQIQTELQDLNIDLERHVQERTDALMQARRQLTEHEARLAGILELAADAIIAINKQQEIVVFNQGAGRIFGYESASVMGKPLDMLLPDGYAESHRYYVHNFGSGMETSRHMGQRGLVYGRRRNGEMFPADASISKMEISGEMTYIVIMRDITDQIQAQQRLRESEAQLRMLTDNASDLICLHSPDGRYLLVSPSCERLLGYTVDEMIGTDSYEYFHPDDIDHVREHHAKHLETRNTANVVYRFRRKDNEYIWLETYNQSVLNADGRITHIVTVSRDISENRKIQEALRQDRDLLQGIMDTNPSGISVVDRSGKIVFANQRAEYIHGIRQDEITQRTFDDTNWHSTDYEGNPIPTEELPFSRVIASGKAIYGIEHALQWPDGRRVLLSINGAPLFDDAGEIEKVVFTIEDVTERVLARQALEESYRRERELNALRSRFITMVSHEFRTPLAIISTSVDLLEMRGADQGEAAYRERLNRIRSQVQNLVRFMEEITNANEYEIKHQILSLVPTNVPGLLQQVITDVQMEFEKPCEVQIKQTCMMESLNVDPHLLRRIFRNLISNACKYGGSNQTIEIELQCDLKDLTLTITDQGIGIPPADIPKLWNLFYRASNVGNISGTGVGLAVVKQSVDTHGGTINVESTLGKRTTFTVRIPHIIESSQ